MNLITHEQVAEKLGATTRTVRHIERTDGAFPHPIRLGPRLVRYDEAETEQWINSKKEQAHAETD